jgi:predicted ester cyclase
MDDLAPHPRQVMRFYDDIWNRRDVGAIPEVLSPSLTFRGSLGSVSTGHDAFKKYVEEVTTALGSYRCDVVALVAGDDKVAARMMFSGIHQGRFMDYQPTGALISWAGAAFFTFDDGMVEDLWVLGDLHQLHEQLRQAITQPADPAH